MLKLCTRDGKLQGVLHQGGVFEKAVITSQTAISENEVAVSLQDKKGKTAKLTLKLLGDRQLRVTFDNGQTFDASKLNSFKACFAPGHKGNEDNGNHNGNNKPMGPKVEHPFGMSGMSF